MNDLTLARAEAALSLLVNGEAREVRERSLRHERVPAGGPL